MLLSEERNFPMYHGQLEHQVFYDKGQVYNFTKVITNEGNNYDRNSGKFICDPAGYYFFTYRLYGERK